MRKIRFAIRMFDHPAWKPHAKATGPGSWFLFLAGSDMYRKRVVSFIDGLNLYHAIAGLQRPELKWLDLRALSGVFLKPHSEFLTEVFYFSSYASHIDGAIQSQKS